MSDPKLISVGQFNHALECASTPEGNLSPGAYVAFKSDILVNKMATTMMETMAPNRIKSKCWDRLLSELETEARGVSDPVGVKTFRDTPDSIAAGHLLERMRRLQTLVELSGVKP